MATSTLISRYFGPSGALRAALPGFVHRPQQQTVAAAIDAAMSAPGSIALLEAGTGVGKTLAYLLPALHRAKSNGRIVVSTHTLALQAQLAEKDVPLVQLVWRKPIQAAVVKGRGNYLCLQDLDAARSDLWTAGDPQFAQIGRWSKDTETGDVSELDFTYAGWADIRANADTCKGQECRFFDRCFYYRMRREAQEATLLLVNHALFSATSPSVAAANRMPSCCPITILWCLTKPITWKPPPRRHSVSRSHPPACRFSWTKSVASPGSWI